jgi:hypothetical protein
MEPDQSQSVCLPKLRGPSVLVRRSPLWSAIPLHPASFRFIPLKTAHYPTVSKSALRLPVLPKSTIRHTQASLPTKSNRKVESGIADRASYRRSSLPCDASHSSTISIKSSNEKTIDDARFHRGRYTQRLVSPNEVVPDGVSQFELTVICLNSANRP